MLYKRSKEKRIWDEKQRHNDNDDQHNEIFEFSHHLPINFVEIVSISCGIMNNSFQESLEYFPIQPGNSVRFWQINALLVHPCIHYERYLGIQDKEVNGILLNEI